MPRILLLFFVALLFSGCASPPKIYKVESVYVCAAEECGQAAQNYGTEQILAGLQQLMTANDGQEIRFCESDPKTRTCRSQGVCHYVQGGPFPGSGCIKSATLSKPLFDGTERRIRLQTVPHMTFLGVSLVCENHEGGITAHSIDEIAWEDKSYYCNWLGIGNMVNTFSFAMESIDFDRGIIGGYWTHANTGTGNGKGSGYAIIEFPKAMPRGDNWLAAP